MKGRVVSLDLVLLKLGGSLITDKAVEHSARLGLIERLAQEVTAALRDRPQMRLVLGHGSGSFGHVPARKYGTRQGVATAEEWQGFVEVWQAAAALDRIVVDGFSAAGVPVIAFPPSAGVVTEAGTVISWNLEPVRSALAAGLVPVVYGDVVFDRAWGATILSTEDLFVYLASRLRPGRVLLAGLEDGVYADYPFKTRLMTEISTQMLETLALAGAETADVTGGMASKVRQALQIAENAPETEVRIFSGIQPGTLRSVLAGKPAGTLVRAA